MFYESSDLGPCNLWAGVRDLSWEMLDCFADDLQVAFNGVFRHVEQIGIVEIQRTYVSLAPFDRLKDIRDTLLNAAAQSATASASAASEIGSLSSCTGKISI